jgi:hypothetical protein
MGLGFCQLAATPTGPRILQCDLPAGPAHVPHINPELIAFTHSTGPVRSVHRPGDPDVYTTSLPAPWSDPYFPIHIVMQIVRASHSTLPGRVCAPSPGAVPGPCKYPAQPIHYPPTASELLHLPNRESSLYEYCMPFGFSPPTMLPLPYKLCHP